MRKVVKVLLVLLMVIGAATGFFELFGFEMTAKAATTSDGYEYEISAEGEVTITGYSGSEKELVIPATIDGYPVKVIGYQAFYKCSNITSVIIPNGVTSIDNYAFYKCSNLTNIVIPDKVTNIDYAAFSGCSSLTEITIPDSVTSIGGSAFSGCSSLKEVTVPGNVTSMDSAAFSNCIGLTDVTILEGLTCISSSAFSDCTSLTKVTIPESVTSIDRSAFARCSSLKEITIPEGVTRISGFAFEYCVSLTSIKLPESLTSLNDYCVFLECSSLTSISIPKSLTFIGYTSIGTCKNLTDVYYSGTEEEWNKIIISYEPSLENATIHYNSTMPTFIPTVDITSVYVPFAGVALDTLATCTTFGVANSDGSIVWLDEAGNAVTEADAEYSKVYSAQITLTPAEGYAFESNAVATVNGNAATSVTKNSDGTLTVIYTFGSTDKGVFVEAESYDSMSGVALRGTKDENSNVISSIDADDYMIYTVNVPETAIYRFDARAARSDSSTSILSLMVDDSVIATCSIGQTGGWSIFSEFEGSELVLEAGTYTFKVYAKGGRYNLNWYKLVYVADAAEEDGNIRIEAENYDSMSGVALRGTKEMGSDVISSVDAGDYMIYTVDITKAGVYRFDVRAARSDASTSVLNLMENDSVIATCGINQTGGWSTFSEFEGTEVYLSAGTHTFKVYAKGGRYNLNWYDLVLVSENAPVTDGSILLEAESYDSMSGVALRGTQEMGSDVISSIDAGDYMIYTVEVPASGTYRFDARAARSDAGTSILNLMENDTVIASCGISTTGGWTTFSDIEGSEVHLTAGTHTFKVYAKGGRYNLNWYKLTCIELDEVA